MASAQSSPRLVAAKLEAVPAHARAAIASLCAAAVACAAGLPPPADSRPATSVRLTGVRVWSTGEVTRVALETAGEARVRHDSLANPDRIYLDLADTRPDGTRAVYPVPSADGPIKQIRVALTLPTVTRVVLDLNGAVEYGVSQLSNPERVMIEVRRAGAPPTPRVEVPAPVEPPPPARIKPEPRVFRLPSRISRRSVPRFVLEAPPRVAPVTVARIRAYSFPIAQPAAPPAQEASDAKVSPPPAPTPAAPEAARVQTVRAEQRTAPPPPTTPAMEPRPAQRNGSGDRSLTRVLGLKLNKVVLDPGHGGGDHGTAGKSVIEKELVLDVSLRLGRLIEDRLGAAVVYTRKEDTFVSLEDRTRIANEKQADLFLSIHANSSPYRNVAGTETYYLSFTDSKPAMELAARENAGSSRSIHELPDLVRQIAQHDKAAESREFAARVQASAYELTAKTTGRVYNRGVKRAPFVVLIGAQMPSVLTEIGFVTNAREEALLQQEAHRQKIAEALYKGIYQYAQTLSHFRVASRSNAAGGQ